MKEILVKKLFKELDENRDMIQNVTLKSMDTVILKTKDRWGEAMLTISYKEKDNGENS